MITVGIPVYNEEKYLSETIQSVLRNIDCIEQVIISDNASTDTTSQICQEYMEKNKKIRYIRHEHQIPVMDNFRTSLELARTKYFMWLGGHDLISDNYIKLLVQELEETSDAIVAVPKVYHFVDDFSQKALLIDFTTNTFSTSIQENRVQAVLETSPTCYTINQVWRRNDLNMIFSSLKLEWIHSDHIVAMHAAILGRYAVNNDCAYYYRRNHFCESQDQQKKRYEDSEMIKIADVNPKYYLPQEYMNLVQKYMPEKLNVFQDKIVMLCRKLFDADLYDSIWLVRHGRIESMHKILIMDKVKKRLMRSDRKYTIFGACSNGELFYQLIKEYVKIDCFLDNDIKKQNKQLAGLIVNPPSYLESAPNYDVIVATTSWSSMDVVNELGKRGYIYGKNIWLYEDFIELFNVNERV